ncbi:MAG: hypothetical protein ACTHOG_13970 [Marmoricola sp.]
MAPTGPMSRYRRWKRKRLSHAPKPWRDQLSTAGIVLLLAGAVFIAIYVIRLH